MERTLLPPVVVKVGGSLLDLEDLAERLRGLFSILAPAPIALVAGGGPPVDVVREWDQRFRLGDQAAHWMAIRAMRMSEGLFAHVFGTSVAETPGDAEELLRDNSIVTLSIAGLLFDALQDRAPTPEESWSVTSDSLAAWAAHRIRARRLVLVKSVDRPESIRTAVTSAMLDGEFEKYSRGLEVEWVNLRRTPIQVVGW